MDACPVEESGRRRLPARAAYLLAGALVVAGVGLGLEPRIQGDGLEYLGMTIGLASHGTPDLRPDDLAELHRLVPWFTAPTIFGYWESPVDGRLYAWHFCLYSLTAVPAWGLLRWLGRDGTAALQVVNALALVAAGYVALFVGRAPRWRRLAFLGLNFTLPTLLYTYWSGPETFTWSLVVIGLTLLDARRHAAAALAVGLAATQNPPLVFLAALFVPMAWHARGWRIAAATALAAAPALLPVAFNLALFRVPNLIAANGNSDPALITAARLGSFFFDLNQGLAPYAPLVLPLAAWSLARGLWRRDAGAAATAAVAAAAVAMAAASCSAPNWNSGGIYLNRYAFWILPVLAWVAVRHLPEAPRTFRAVRATVLFQAITGAFLAGDAVSRDYKFGEVYNGHTPQARLVLHLAPTWYNPDAEIFAERTLGTEVPRPWPLPVAYLDEQGSASKLLVDAPGLARLPEAFDLPPGFLDRALRRYGDRPGFFYLHPRPGMVRPKPPAAIAMQPTP